MKTRPLARPRADGSNVLPIFGRVDIFRPEWPCLALNRPRGVDGAARLLVPENTIAARPLHQAVSIAHLADEPGRKLLDASAPDRCPCKAPPRSSRPVCDYPNVTWCSRAATPPSASARELLDASPSRYQGVFVDLRGAHRMRLSAANRVHQPLRLDETRGVDLVPFPLRGDALADGPGDLGVVGSPTAQEPPDVRLVECEQAVAQLAVGVSRRRLQLMQNGRLTEAMKPTRPPPSAYS